MKRINKIDQAPDQAAKDEDKPITALSVIKDEQKAAIISEVINSLTLHRTDTNTREITEEIISPAVTRFIDLFDKKGETYTEKADEFGNPLEIGGPLGDIPAFQMPYIQMSNFNNVYIKLRDGIYLDVYEMDADGVIKKGADGQPILKYTKVINVGIINRKLQLLANLAVNGSRAKLQAQAMVGQGGGNPLSVGGSWDDTLALLLGGQKKK